MQDVQADARSLRHSSREGSCYHKLLARESDDHESTASSVGSLPDATPRNLPIRAQCAIAIGPYAE
jgi:hypothetical protein